MGPAAAPLRGRDRVAHATEAIGLLGGAKHLCGYVGSVMTTDDPSPEPEASPRGEAEPVLICERCGCYGAVVVGEHRLCLDCYSGCGSCCPEFGPDDLWEFPAE